MGDILRPSGISATNCLSRISIASRLRWRWGFGIPTCRTPASSRSSTGLSPFAPDGNPLVGPVRGLPRLLGRVRRRRGLRPRRRRRLGAPNSIIMAIPARTVSGHGRRALQQLASMAYTSAKVRENYSRRFSIRFPNEELPAGRPLKTTPVYDLLVGEGRAVGRRLRAGSAAVVSRRRASRTNSPGGARPISSMSRSEVRHGARSASASREISNFAKYSRDGARARRLGSTACSPAGCRSRAA